MATSKHDECMFGKEFLTDILTWIGENLEPDDVFTDDYLKEWVQQNFEADEIFGTAPLPIYTET